MSDDVDRAKAMIEMLRARGVRRARFDGGNLFEVEFFGDASSPESGDVPNTLPAEAGGIEDYEAALQQLKKRRFRKEVS